MEPELIAVIVALLACTVGVAALSLVLGLSRLQAAVWALIATGGLAALVVVGFYATLAECLFEGDSDYGFAWQWSPRREFCDEENSPAQLGAYSLLAFPPLVVSVAAILWSRGRRAAAYLVSLTLAAVVFLPFAYIEALPVYPIDTTPVLHVPYLRVATDDRPARACYVYGLVDETPPPNAERVCVDLEPTPEALALTPEYDQGVTSYALGWLGRALTENAMEPGTEWEGLVVERVYRLPGLEAREDSELVRTY